MGLKNDRPKMKRDLNKRWRDAEREEERADAVEEQWTLSQRET